LRSIERQENVQCNPWSLLTTGMQSGHRFTLDGCSADTSGMVIRYKAAAVPLKQGTTGFRAFCIDETALMRYDDSGIGAKCLTSDVCWSESRPLYFTVHVPNCRVAGQNLFDATRHFIARSDPALAAQSLPK